MSESLITLDQICSVNVLQAVSSDPLLSTLRRMRIARVSSIIVVDGNTPCGIITEQDILKLVSTGKDLASNTCVSDVMNSPVSCLPRSTEYQSAYQLMQDQQLRHIVVTEASGELYGVVTETDFVQNLGVEYLLDIKDVDAVMERVIQFVPGYYTLQAAFEVLSHKKISCVVVGSTRSIEGILTERDVIRLLDDQIDMQQALVCQHMSSPVSTIPSGTPLFEARQIMQRSSIRRLIVCDTDGSALGLITRKNLIDQLQSRFISLLREAVQNLKGQLNSSIENEKRYRGFFEGSPLAYQSLDGDGNLIEINASWRKLMGFSTEEVKGRPFQEFLTPASAERFPDCYRRFLQHGEMSGICLQMQPKQGPALEIEFAGKVAVDERGVFLQTHCLLTNQTEQKLVEAQLRLFRQQIDLCRDGVFVIEAQSARILDVNQAASRYLGYSRSEFLSMTVMDFSSTAADLEQWLSVVDTLHNSPEGAVYETTHFHKNGTGIPIELSAICQESNDGDIFVATARDISERKAAEQKIQQERDFLQAVIDSVSDPIMVIDRNNQIMKANKAASESYFGAARETVPRYCHSVTHSEKLPCSHVSNPCPLREVVDSNAPTTLVHNYQDKSGKHRVVELIASPLRDDTGQITGIVESSRDITDHIAVQQELKKKEKSLDHLAHHDPLTQLPNRLLFTDRLDQALLSAKRSNSCVALLFIDLDQFKEVNDSFGHSLGDQLLKEVARRLQFCIRESDTLARLGGDEFTIITGTLAEPEDASVIAQHLIDEFKQPCIVDGHRLHVTLSIGISLFPEDGINSEELLRNADTAMYRAKSAGRNRYEFYTADMTHQAFERILMVSALRTAIEQQEFILHFQPQVELSSNRIVGAEALIRWQSPEMGLIEPERFIPVAEKSGLIHSIDLWVLDAVCSKIVHWRKKGFTVPRIAVNISAEHFSNDSLAKDVEKILERHQLEGSAIELEITEGVILNNPTRASHELNQLREKGIHLAIDDFGTGYSSLSYLKKLPLDRLKIDRSFIMDIPGDQNDQEISKAIIALAKNLRLEVIAEGMETELQQDFLVQEGCNLAQGFFFSKGVAESDFLKLLNNNLVIAETAL
ncbi:EAL domain-containing protein [Amphritea sp. HPY]|uniref:EAL domain-containing protein n=1 Tax=Amphritea sp. HPY TaxID=3421652 RepID=UPI003D7D81DE